MVPHRNSGSWVRAWAAPTASEPGTPHAPISGHSFYPQLVQTQVRGWSGSSWKDHTRNSNDLITLLQLVPRQ